MLPVLHVFADASQNGQGGPCAGAWIVGMGGTPFQLSLDCRSNIQAELLTMIAGLQSAMLMRKEGQRILVHTDLKHIASIMRKARRGPAAELRWLLRKANAQIVADARNFREYRLCHKRAQIQARCHGRFHPLIVPAPAARSW